MDSVTRIVDVSAQDGLIAAISDIARPHVRCPRAPDLADDIAHDVVLEQLVRLRSGVRPGAHRALPAFARELVHCRRRLAAQRPLSGRRCQAGRGLDPSEQEWVWMDVGPARRFAARRSIRRLVIRHSAHLLTRGGGA
jgi:hypothetical protein